MGTSSSSSSNTKTIESTSNSSNVENLLQSSSDTISNIRNMIKLANESQYSVYKAFQSESRMQKQLTIGQDICFFMQMVEEQHKGRMSKNSTSVINKDTQKIRWLILLNQVSALSQLVSNTLSFYQIGSQLLQKCSESIEIIDIALKKERKIIKLKGLKKQLDQSQLDLFETSQSFENFIINKLQLPPLDELNFCKLRLSAMKEEYQKQLTIQNQEAEEDQKNQHAVAQELFE